MNVLTSKSAQFENRIANMINVDAKNFTRLDEMLLESLYGADKYLKSRLYEAAGFTDASVSTVALARLNWVLEEGRKELVGIFTASEFATLSSSHQDEIAGPESIMRIADMLGNDLGLSPDSYKESSHAPLIEKLLMLSQLQALALRDLLEEYWHVGMQSMTCKEFLISKKLISNN